MRTRVTGKLLIPIVATLLAVGVASAQDRGAGAGAGAAQGAGRGGRGGGGLAMLTVTSTSFADGAEIPAKYAGGQGISPQLSWSGAPATRPLRSYAFSSASTPSRYGIVVGSIAAAVGMAGKDFEKAAAYAASAAVGSTGRLPATTTPRVRALTLGSYRSQALETSRCERSRCAAA